MFRVCHCNWELSLTRSIHQPKENKQPMGCDAQLEFGELSRENCSGDVRGNSLRGNVWGMFECFVGYFFFWGGVFFGGKCPGKFSDEEMSGDKCLEVWGIL